MAKSKKIGGNIFNNLNVKDPSLWLNIVIVLLIVVVFVLLAVQVFTPRKDVLDGFVTIPITNRNLPWPFNDVKFDPLYYSLVFTGKTKNGSAHGDGVIYFSKSFMPINKDNLPSLVQKEAGGEGDGVDDAEYTIGASKVGPAALQKANINGKQVKLYKLKLGDGQGKVGGLLKIFLNDQFPKYKNKKLSFWTRAKGVEGELDESSANVLNNNNIFEKEYYLPILYIKDYLKLARKVDIDVLGAGVQLSKKDISKVKQLLNQGNYDEIIEQLEGRNENNSLILFTGVWKEGKLTKAEIRNCKGNNEDKEAGEKFVLFYNDKEQLEDQQSVEYAIQFLRTPLYASCMGNLVDENEDK